MFIGAGVTIWLHGWHGGGVVGCGQLWGQGGFIRKDETIERSFYLIQIFFWNTWVVACGHWGHGAGKKQMLHWTDVWGCDCGQFLQPCGDWVEQPEQPFKIESNWLNWPKYDWNDQFYTKIKLSFKKSCKTYN